MARCRICGFNHQEKNCPAFKAMRPSERRQAAIRHKLCLNCMAQTHLRENCDSDEHCRGCEAKHHSMIHRPRPENVLNTSFENIPLSTRIWPIVQGTLVFKTKPILANLLIDQKTDCSFVTRNVIKRIFEGQASDAKIPSLRLELSVPSAPWVSIEGIFEVKEVYTFEVQQPIHDARFDEHVCNVQPIANPCFQEEQVIDGVIGRNLLPELVLETHLSPNIEPLSAMPTKFGWVLSGHWAGCEDDHLLKRQWQYKLDLFSAGGGC